MYLLDRSCLTIGIFLKYCVPQQNLVEKIDKSGFEEVKTLTSNVPTLLDYKAFNCDIDL